MLFDSLPLRSAPLAAGISLAAAVLLGACSSPMPKPKPAVLEPFRPVPPPVETPAPPPPPPPAAVPQPISPDGGAPAVEPAPAAPPISAEPTEPPYGPAVAAHFPDPRVRYDTPGLQPDRSEFTTQQELREFMQSLAERATDPAGVQVQVLPLGDSQDGVPLQALRLTRPATDGVARPVVLLIGQQHGDEPATAEALIVIARELAQGKLAELLNRIDVIVVPRANPDGVLRHTRTGANGVDINRDHLLLKTPEAQALARLVRDFAPTVVVDAHEYSAVGRFLEKFGAVQRYDALLQYAMTANLPDFTTRASEEWFRRPVLAALKREQLSSEWYYTTSSDPADKLVSMGGVQPDTSRNVNGLKNTVSFLVASRGAGLGRVHIQRRVHTQVTAIASLLASAASRAQDLAKLRAFVDADVRSKACQGQVTVDAGATRSEYNLLMLDPTTGADKAVTVDWNSSLTLQVNKRRARPCGYWLSADAGDAVQRLRMLGIQVMQLSDKTSLVADTFREISRRDAQRQDVRGAMDDGGTIVSIKVDLVNAVIDVPAGSYIVPLTQPLANLAVAAMEPDTQNGYLANGLIPGLDRVARLRAIPDAALLLPMP